jgi:spermidine/putrescine transport system substrate-binding protein
MKKIVVALIITAITFGVAACSGRTRLKVFMPGEYISADLVSAFEDEFNVRVDIITFDSNESAIPQIEANVYDVIIPSDYAIEELVSKGLLEEIDWSLLTNLNKSELDEGLVGILDLVKEQENGFDLLKYGVPYFWGNVGILYNQANENVRPLLEAEGWNALRNSNFKVMFYDSSRDMFMIAMKDIFGNTISINSPTTEEVAQAETWLIDAKNPNLVFLTDEVLDDMLDPARHDMAVVYSGDAVYLMDENENLGFFVPERGTNVWVDLMVVPKNVSQRELAYNFINFMVSYDSMYDNTYEIGYTSPRSDVIQAIIDAEIYDPQSYVVTVGPNDEVFRYNTELKRQIEEAWARVRAA